MTEPPALDLQVIERLNSWGGRDLVSQLIDLFIENTPNRMEQVRSGLESGEIQQVERACHSLKSSAANLGASRLHFLAAEMEEVAARGDGDALEGLSERLDGIYEDAVERLKTLRAKDDS